MRENENSPYSGLQIPLKLKKDYIRNFSWITLYISKIDAELETGSVINVFYIKTEVIGRM